MAPTIGESNAIFTVLRWMGLDRRDGFTPTDEQAANALVLLAQKAGKVLLVTADEQEVRAAFANLAAARRGHGRAHPGNDQAAEVIR